MLSKNCGISISVFNTMLICYRPAISAIPELL
jgi:hypothetical protein